MFPYNIDEEKQLVSTKLGGMYALGNIYGLIDSVLRDPRYDPSMSGLIIVQNPSNDMLLREDEFKGILEGLVLGKRLLKWAFVFENNLTLGVAEYLFKDLMFEPDQLQFFESEKDALGWLFG